MGAEGIAAGPSAGGKRGLSGTARESMTTSSTGSMDTTAPLALICEAEPAWISSAVDIVCDEPITFHS